MIERLKPEFSFEDERGALFQLFSSGWQQVNVSFTKKGVERGCHYHKQNREIFFIVSGKCRLSIKDLNTGEEEEQTLMGGEMVMVHPNEIHTFNYDEDTVMVAAYDIGFLLPDGTKDVFDN